MNSAAAIIEALNARIAPPGRMREAARASWRGWFDRIAERPGRVVGARAEDLVDQLAAREPAPAPARSAALNRWQAFATLWRQEWHPASHDETSWRWTAGGTSFAWHVAMVLLLLWIAAVHLIPPPPRSEDAVQVEFIGIGTPSEQGGGEPPAPGERVDAPSAAAASSAASAVAANPSPSEAPATPGLPVPEVEAPVPDIATRDVPEPRPAPQPLVVSPPVSTEPPVFELPPTTPPQTPVALPDLARVPPVRVVEVPEPVRAPPASVAPPRVALEPTRAPVPSVAEREVPDPVRLPALAAPAPSVQAPSVQATTPAVARRDVPAPAVRDGAAASQAPAARDVSASAATANAQAGADRGDASRASGPPVASARPGIGAGPDPTPAPGSWATPRRADDWGVSDRNRPGRGDGARDGDGRPRVGAAPGSAAPGSPPGTYTAEIRDLDRAGTWLKRKPYPYEPTRFDRFWRPNESLLEEWVRRGVKQVSIPIPGSSKRIVCAISILQFGGGCWPEDPNVNEQPASARPPPDIPFKPHLQEGTGVTAPPPQDAGRPPGQ